MAANRRTMAANLKKRILGTIAANILKKYAKKASKINVLWLQIFRVRGQKSTMAANRVENKFSNCTESNNKNSFRFVVLSRFHICINCSYKYSVEGDILFIDLILFLRSPHSYQILALSILINVSRNKQIHSYLENI